ncbi:hypothetical protein [Halobellus salinisoli]|uniref:hypothetical protein n=1 Tax=Halobellus salinisoli TaxID=3108500 RepID=UPI00300BE0FB
MIAFVLGSGGMGTASFSTSDTPRENVVNVTSDESAAHSLDVASAVHINATDPLVNVTNRLEEDVTVTVTLRSDSTQIGDLVVDGTNDGNETTFTLAEQNTQTVKIMIPDDTSLTTETVYFHVSATAPSLEVSAPDRNAPVNE